MNNFDIEFQRAYARYTYELAKIDLYALQLEVYRRKIEHDVDIYNSIANKATELAASAMSAVGQQEDLTGLIHFCRTSRYSGA